MGKNYSTHLTKQIGENLLVAKLGELGIVASILTGNVPDIDILAYHPDGKSFPIQVKTQRKGSVSVDAKNFIKISFDETTNPPKIIQKVLGKQKINKDLIYVVIFCRKELEAAKFKKDHPGITLGGSESGKASGTYGAGGDPLNPDKQPAQA